jgi:chromate transport protein ChrA
MQEQRAGLADLTRAFLQPAAMSCGGPAIIGILRAELQAR